MKFSCEHCGKRFASVDEPAAGRVYRIRCRCGGVIVVRGPTARAEPGARRGERRPKAARAGACAPERKAIGAHPPPLPPAQERDASAPEPATALPREPTPVIADDPFARAVAEAIAAGGRQEVTAPVDGVLAPSAAAVPATVVARSDAGTDDGEEISVELSPHGGARRSPRTRLGVRAAVAVGTVVLALGAGAGARVMTIRSPRSSIAAPTAASAEASTSTPAEPDAAGSPAAELPTVAIRATFPAERRPARRPRPPAPEASGPTAPPGEAPEPAAPAAPSGEPPAPAAPPPDAEPGDRPSAAAKEMPPPSPLPELEPSRGDGPAETDDPAPAAAPDAPEPSTADP